VRPWARHVVRSLLLGPRTKISLVKARGATGHVHTCSAGSFFQFGLGTVSEDEEASRRGAARRVCGDLNADAGDLALRAET